MFFRKGNIKFSIGCIILVLAGYTAKAVDSLFLVNNVKMGIDVHYGSVFPHHQSIHYSLERNIQALEITLETNTYGRSAWDKLYRYPRMGTGYMLTSLGSRNVYGVANALFLYMNIPFHSEAKNFFTGYQINFGIAYIDRLFHITDNPLNMAISSGMNVYASFRLNTKYIIDEKSELSFSFGFSHFSNGKLATPNLGINTGSLALGYQYRLAAPRYPKVIRYEPVSFTKHNFELILSAGLKTDDGATGNYYLISTLVFDYKYLLNLKYGVGAGTDIFYDQSLGPNKVNQVGGTYSFADLLQLGIHGAFYAKYSRLNIFVNLGTYLLADYFKYSRIYSRVGFRYELDRHIFLNLSLKAHYAIADYIEWGIGYRF